jgi:hypothetical protein
VSGNEIMVLGDSFVAQSHQITAYLEEYARQAGTLQAGERFRDYSSVTANSLALIDKFLAKQYTNGESEAAAKVVLLCGGGADVLAGTCANPPTTECPMLIAATAAAEQLLAQMATDGVSDVLWFFYPDPIDTGLRAKMDLLRPMVQNACANSAARCHFIDLRSTFEGHYAEYIASDGMNPTAAGSQAAAEAIWATMKSACIAQ